MMPTKHCLKVMRIIDWKTKPICRKLKKPLKGRKTLKDKICGNIDISCGERALLWKISGDLTVSGWVTLCYQTGCEQMEVIINGRSAFLLAQEEQATMYFHHLESVEIRCRGNGRDVCIGKYFIILCYDLSKIALNSKSRHIKCYLSDKDGNPTHSFTCQELKPRKSIECTLFDGEIFTLQKIKILNTGYVTVKATEKAKECILCTIPFHFIETFILCAPSETFLECNISKLDCTVSLASDCTMLEIDLCYCLEVQVLANAVIEMKAKFCQPRHEIAPCLEIPYH